MRKQEQLSLSFNGGKDCTVLLHLYAAALSRRLPQTSTFSIPAVYIPCASPFQELESFIHETVESYSLDLFSTSQTAFVGNDTPYVGSPLQDESPKRSGGGEMMRQALGVYKDAFPQVQAILIGTRRTDPHGEHLSFRNLTDPSWPRFERINPIINWSYSAVWNFLTTLQVPYCCLYDQGYTSIGSTYNTFPNPALRIKLPAGKLEKGDSRSSLERPEYRPAYELLDESLERAGRGLLPSKDLAA